jgi:hypothetical protein
MSDKVNLQYGDTKHFIRQVYDMNTMLDHTKYPSNSILTWHISKNALSKLPYLKHAERTTIAL